MNITIYSTKQCAACYTLEQWLQGKDVAYEKKITDENPAYMQEFMEVNDGMIGVPFTLITTDDGKVEKISGFDKKRFESLLGL